MKTRPRILVLMAVALFLAALSFPIQIIATHARSFAQVLEVLHYLTPVNYLMMALALLSGFFILQGSRWTLIFSALFFITTAWNNWILAGADQRFAPWAPWSLLLGVIFIHMPLLTPIVRRMLQDPRVRWWLTPPRFRTGTQAIIWPVLGGEFKAETYDLSEGGAFLIPSNAFTPQHEKKFSVGSRCSVRIRFNNEQIFHCRGQIVRLTQAKGKYPAGIGIRFMSLDSTDRDLLKKYLSQFTKDDLLRGELPKS